MEILDEALLNFFRLLTRCEWCRRETNSMKHPHHLWRKGLGGGNRQDLAINLIGLCWECHGLAHDGKIMKSDLLAVVADREGVTQDEIRSAMVATRRLHN